MMYQIIVIGILAFTVISISDTTPVSATSAPQEPKNDIDTTTLSDVVRKSVFKNDNTVNKKPILNYEDMQKLLKFVCFRLSKVSKNNKDSVIKARAAIQHAYSAMKEEKDINVACNKTENFTKSVDEYVTLQKRHNKKIILKEEIMQTIIYSVCHPEEFYENHMNSHTIENTCNRSNIVMMLFSPTVVFLIGQGAIKRAFSNMTHEYDSQVCKNRSIDFNNAVQNYINIQDKYNNKITLNTKIMDILINYRCNENYIDFLKNESSEYALHVTNCHEKEFGVTVNLNPEIKTNNKTDIIPLLFAPISIPQSTNEIKKKGSYFKCLQEFKNAKNLISNFSSLIPASITIPHKKESQKSSTAIWIYILTSVIIVICAISVFMLLRCVKKQDRNEEFELKTHKLEEKTNTKY